ncbi:MAG: T9SS type A sorting domain-containing protein [Candidatus Cloacimonetes bacterium]|nr:T9SS type A sorting domain-containing protein [Candidatus Cloacimonadota bacterium]
MKQSMLILLISILAMLSSMAFAQSGYVYNESLPIVRIASRSIYVCSDNSVVVLSSVDDTMDEWWYYHLAITKLDPYGNLLWRQWLNPSGWPACTITGVDIDAEDTVTFIVTWIGSSVIQLATIDSDGVVAPLSDPIDLPYFSITFNKALRTPNNEIVAVGKAYQHDWVLWPDVSSACYFRFSSAGDTLATAFWPVDQGSSELVAEAYDLALMDNGNILIACRLHTYNCSILEVNPDGTLVNRFDLQGEYHSYNVAICRESNNASYIIAYVMGEYPDHSIQVDRFENGVFEPLFSISLSRFFVNSMILGTDNIYLCGKLGLYGSLLSLTYSGELNWSWEQEGGNMCEVDWKYGSRSAALLALDNEDCIYWAWGDDLYGAQIITKLLPNGQLPIEDEVQTPPVSTISAYPNPMKNHVSIKIVQDDQMIRNDNIDIFNIKGQLVRSLKLVNNETNWDGKDKQGRICPNGIYLLRSSNRNTHTTKICKTR